MKSVSGRSREFSALLCLSEVRDRALSPVAGSPVQERESSRGYEDAEWNAESRGCLT